MRYWLGYIVRTVEVKGAHVREMATKKKQGSSPLFSFGIAAAPFRIVSFFSSFFVTSAPDEDLIFLMAPFIRAWSTVTAPLMSQAAVFVRLLFL